MRYETSNMISNLRDFFKSTYQASCDIAEKKTCDYGTKKLCNPVEDAGEDGDVATKSQSKSHGRVDMATRDVGTNRNCNKKCKTVANSNRQ